MGRVPNEIGSLQSPSPRTLTHHVSRITFSVAGARRPTSGISPASAPVGGSNPGALVAPGGEEP